MKRIIIADKMIEYRQKNQITQKELAAQLGVCHQAISKWERCENYPDIIFLPSIAKILNCSIDDFFVSY
ncbi:MAG: helix-turn-helix transcriptional regulator [Clostridia bacterium]|nr:helix-turn-helix transcriptional regulator [Clostridia bacterium]